MLKQALVALSLLPLAFAVYAAASYLAPPVVSQWRSDYSVGESAPVVLRAHQVFAIKITDGCDSVVKYPVSVDVYNATTQVRVVALKGTATSPSKSCTVSVTLADFEVPDDGNYVVRWAIPSAMAAGNPSYSLRQPYMPTWMSISCIPSFFVFIVLLAAAGSVDKRSVRKREAAASKPSGETPHKIPVPRIVEEPPVGSPPPAVEQAAAPPASEVLGPPP